MFHFQIQKAKTIGIDSKATVLQITVLERKQALLILHNRNAATISTANTFQSVLKKSLFNQYQSD